MRTERHWRPYPVDKDTCGLYLPAHKYGGEIGATMLDISGNNHHGVITGAVPYPGEGEKLLNGNFESWASATDANGWTEGFAGTSTVNREGTNQRSGLFCLRLDIDALSNYAYASQSFTLIPGKRYRLTGWYFNSLAGKTGKATLYDTGGNVSLKSDGTWQAGTTGYTLSNALTWTRISIDFTAHSSYTQYKLELNRGVAASSSIYYDDWSIIPLDSEPAVGWYLDGVDDVITVADFLEMGNSAKELTVLVWQKYFALATTKYLISHWDDVLDQRAWTMRYAASNKVTVLITDDGLGGVGHLKNYTTSITGWSNSSWWMLIGFTFNNGTLTLYANGVPDTNPTKTTDSAITTIHNSTVALVLGCTLSNGAWSTGAQCAVGEALIFNRALTAIEIRNYYDLTRHRYGV